MNRSSLIKRCAISRLANAATETGPNTTQTDQLSAGRFFLPAPGAQQSEPRAMIISEQS